MTHTAVSTADVGEHSGDEYFTYCAVCRKKTWHKCLNIAGKLVWICTEE